MKAFAPFVHLILCAGCTAGSIQGADREAIENEIRVGRSLAARLAKKYGLVRDEALTSYVSAVGRAIASRSSRPELTFYVGILDTDETNAYSCPGGYIFLTRGALQNMVNESELAFVLAHEISHVAFQHSGRFQRGSGVVDFVAGILGGAGGNVVNSAVRQATDELEQTLLEKGRQKNLEYDADQAGILLASQLNYSADAGVKYIARIGDAPGTETLAKTHPSAADRVTLMKRFLLEQGVTQPSTEDRADRFAQFQARLQSGQKK